MFTHADIMEVMADEIGRFRPKHVADELPTSAPPIPFAKERVELPEQERALRSARIFFGLEHDAR